MLEKIFPLLKRITAPKKKVRKDAAGVTGVIERSNRAQWQKVKTKVPSDLLAILGNDDSCPFLVEFNIYLAPSNTDKSSIATLV